jgi:hypothetical protein
VQDEHRGDWHAGLSSWSDTATASVLSKSNAIQACGNQKCVDEAPPTLTTPLTFTSCCAAAAPRQASVTAANAAAGRMDFHRLSVYTCRRHVSSWFTGGRRAARLQRAHGIRIPQGPAYSERSTIPDTPAAPLLGRRPARARVPPAGGDDDGPRDDAYNTSMHYVPARAIRRASGARRRAGEPAWGCT